MARPRTTSTEEIIRVAADLFLEQGFHNTSIDDVANAANVSKPTVYQYVKNKQWLLDQIMLQVLTEFSSALQPWDPEAESLDDQLDWYISLHIARATRLRVFYRILFSEETEMSVSVRRRWRSLAHDVNELFTAFLELYRERGRIARDIDLRVVANLLMTMLVSLHRWYEPSGQVPEDELRTLIRSMIHGLISPDAADA